MDFTTMTSAIDLGTVATALLAVGAIKVVPGAIQYGVRKILGMIGRG